MGAVRGGAAGAEYIMLLITVDGSLEPDAVRWVSRWVSRGTQYLGSLAVPPEVLAFACPILCLVALARGHTYYEVSYLAV